VIKGVVDFALKNRFLVSHHSLVLSIFILPTIYVWVARETDVLPAPESHFAS